MSVDRDHPPPESKASSRGRGSASLGFPTTQYQLSPPHPDPAFAMHLPGGHESPTSPPFSSVAGSPPSGPALPFAPSPQQHYRAPVASMSTSSTGVPPTLPPIDTAPPARASSATQPQSSPISPTALGDGDADDVGGGGGEDDKRKRNTQASARFRIKKKQRTLNLERTVSDLTGRAEDLECEANNLRRENGWLKEIVMLRGAVTAEHKDWGLGQLPARESSADESEGGAQGER